MGIQAVLATMATPTKSRGEHYQQCTTHNNMLSATHSVRTHYSKHEYSVNVSNSMINTVLFVASCFKRHVSKHATVNNVANLPLKAAH